MTLQTSDSPKLVVELTDNTQVAQVQGVFKARRKEMSMAALTLGLKVKVEGTYGTQNQLSEDRADKVTEFFQQQGHIALTRMPAPGAMGEPASR